MGIDHRDAPELNGTLAARPPRTLARNVITAGLGAARIQPMWARWMCWECSAPRRKRSPSSPAQRIEVSQIRRRLILLGRHQMAVHAAQVGLLAEKHIAVVLGADVLDPGRVADAAVAPGPRPGPGPSVNGTW